MKKIIVVAFAILTTGFISSCTKDNSVKPAIKTTKVTTGDLTTGSADGTPPPQ